MAWLSIRHRNAILRAVQEPQRPRVFYGWWIVAAGFLNQAFAAALLQRSFGTYSVLLREEFGWSKTELAAAASMQQLENGLLGPAQGWFVDRFGPRVSMRLGVAAFGIGFILFSQVQTLTQFYGAFLLMALGSNFGGFFPLSVVTVNWFNRKRARALSTLQMGMALGGLLITVVVWALEAYGWRQIAFVSGILVLIVGLPVTQIVRSRPEDYGLRVDGDPVEPAPAATSDPSTSAAAARRRQAEQGPDFTLAQAMRTPAFWLISLGHASALLIVVALNQHLALYITEDLAYSLTFAATVQTILTVAQLVGIVLSGVVGDLWDKRWVAVGCMGFHTIGLLLIAHTRLPLLLFTGATLHGVAWGLRGPLMNGIRADYFGRRSFGAILGMSSMLVTVGTIAGPLFAGFLADRTGSYELGFTILAIISGIGSIFFVVARRPPPPAAPPVITPTEAAANT